MIAVLFAGGCVAILTGHYGIALALAAVLFLSGPPQHTGRAPGPRPDEAASAARGRRQWDGIASALRRLFN